MINIKDLKVGAILSESSFFTVQNVTGESIEVLDDLGNALSIGRPYVEQILNSADIYSSEEKKTKTELAELFLNSPRIAMTVAFYKQDKDKTKKAYNAEVTDAITKVTSARVSEVEGLLRNLIENPILSYIPGELRVMKGRHYGQVDDMGRVHFTDMEIAKTPGATDSRLRQVDPRTIQYIIVNNIKYSLK